MERSRNLRISTSMPISTAASRTSAPPNHKPQRAKRRTPVNAGSMRQPLACTAAVPPPQLQDQLYGVGALRFSALPTVSFHSFAHSAPHRFAQPESTAPSTSFLCVSASSGFTATIVVLASLPMVQGCLPVLQLSASPVVVLIVAHILSS